MIVAPMLLRHQSKSTACHDNFVRLFKSMLLRLQDCERRQRKCVGLRMHDSLLRRAKKRGWYAAPTRASELLSGLDGAFGARDEQAQTGIVLSDLEHTAQGTKLLFFAHETDNRWRWQSVQVENIVDGKRLLVSTPCCQRGLEPRMRSKGRDPAHHGLPTSPGCARRSSPIRNCGTATYHLRCKCKFRGIRHVLTWLIWS